MELITTTVAIDAQKTGDQVTLHLVQGDYGTVKFQFVATSGGSMIDMSPVALAKVRVHSTYWDPSDDLLINCAIQNGNIYMTPTQALTQNINEYSAQLVLLDSSNQTLSSLPFTIVVHNNVYMGEAVEHTNNSLTEFEWTQATLVLTAKLLDGTTVSVALPHIHPDATGSAAGFMSAAMYNTLQQLAGWMNQGVKTTDDPTFAGLHIGDLSIDSEGNISGARFT